MKAGKRKEAKELCQGLVFRENHRDRTRDPQGSSAHGIPRQPQEVTITSLRSRWARQAAATQAVKIDGVSRITGSQESPRSRLT